MPARRKTDEPDSKATKTEISSRLRQRKAKDKATDNISSLINGLHHMSKVNGCKKEKTEDKISLAHKLEMVDVKPEKKPSKVKPKTGILHVSDEKKEIIMSSSPTCPSRKKVSYPLYFHISKCLSDSLLDIIYIFYKFVKGNI